MQGNHASHIQLIFHDIDKFHHPHVTFEHGDKLPLFLATFANLK
jgi:hypothetical protein